MALIALLAGSLFSSAASITFAQFTDAGAQNFSLINNSDGSQTFSTSAPVNFSFSNVAGLPVWLSGPITANLTLSATSSQSVGITTIAGSQYAYIGGFSGSFQFTATGSGFAGHTDLLSGTFNNQTILLGVKGGQSATFSDSTSSGFPLEVKLNSDIVMLLPKQENFSISLSSIFDTQVGDAGINVVGQNVDNFTASATGTFASDPPPVFTTESACIELNCRGRHSSLPRNTQTKMLNPILGEPRGPYRRALTSRFSIFLEILSSLIRRFPQVRQRLQEGRVCGTTYLSPRLRRSPDAAPST
jgi:hypothetical protein